MRKIILLILLLNLSAPAEEINFFGIRRDETAENNVIRLINGLIDGDQEKINAAYAKIEELDPELAGVLKVEELKIPCSQCNGTGILVTGSPCRKCNGSRLMSDANALRFVMDRFLLALDTEPSNAAAWKKAVRSFEKYRDRISTKEVLFGTVIRKEKEGLLLSLSPDENEVYLKNMNATQAYKGSTISGTAWRDGTYTYTNNLGESVEVPCYTASLWEN